MSSKDNSIFKVRKENNYVAIDNKIFSDDSLSWKAKGILGYLLSKPSDWEVRIKDLKKQSTNGRDSVMAGLKELECKNYIHKEKRRNDRGHFKGWTYLVFENPAMNDVSPKPESPKSENPIPGRPTSEDPKLENPIHTNKDSTKTDRTYKRVNKKRSTTISGPPKITPEIEKVISAWDDTFEVVVDKSDNKLIDAISIATQDFEISDLLQAIKYQSRAKFYKEDYPHLRDDPKYFFCYPKTIKNDMNRCPFKLITYNKKCQLEQDGTAKKFENVQPKKIISNALNGECMIRHSSTIINPIVRLRSMEFSWRTPPLIHRPTGKAAGTMKCHPVCPQFGHLGQRIGRKKDSKQGVVGPNRQAFRAPTRPFLHLRCSKRK